MLYFLYSASYSAYHNTHRHLWMVVNASCVFRSGLLHFFSLYPARKIHLRRLPILQFVVAVNLLSSSLYGAEYGDVLTSCIACRLAKCPCIFVYSGRCEHCAKTKSDCIFGSKSHYQFKGARKNIVQVACTNCRAQKRACDLEDPCTRCERKKLKCERIPNGLSTKVDDQNDTAVDEPPKKRAKKLLLEKPQTPIYDDS